MVAQCTCDIRHLVLRAVVINGLPYFAYLSNILMKLFNQVAHLINVQLWIKDQIGLWRWSMKKKHRLGLWWLNKEGFLSTFAVVMLVKIGHPCVVTLMHVYNKDHDQTQDLTKKILIFSLINDANLSCTPH